MKFTFGLITAVLLFALPGHAQFCWSKSTANQVLLPSTDAASWDPVPTSITGLNQNTHTQVPPPNEFSSNHSPLSAFRITYVNFPENARIAFEYAMSIWSSLLTTTIPIHVRANWTPIVGGRLARSLPVWIYYEFSGGQETGSWYPMALAEQLAHTELNNPDSADILIDLNSVNTNWYLGTDRKTPAGYFDFVTVVIHELAHGLGFMALMNVTGGQGTWGAGSSYPCIFERFVWNGAHQQLIDISKFPNPSAELARQFTGGTIYFDGPRARASNNSQAPKLFAPATWSTSSISHLDEATFPPGNQNSLMTPELAMAEAIHSPGPATLGMMADLGWATNTSATDGEPTADLPREAPLLQSYPNPFNSATTIRFTLLSRSHVTLTLFNTLGQKVRELVDGEVGAGRHEVQFEAGGLSSGVYLCRISVTPSAYHVRTSADGSAGTDGKGESAIETKRLVLLR